jgi:hypothetical protein
MIINYDYVLSMCGCFFLVCVCVGVCVGGDTVDRMGWRSETKLTPSLRGGPCG